jgi:hypothetical protein
MGSQAVPTFDDFVKSSTPVPELAPPPLVAIKPPAAATAPPSFDEFDKTEVKPSLLKEFGVATVDQLIGMAKGAGSTAWGINEMLHKYIPGISWATNKLSDYTLGHHITPEEFAKARDTLNLKPKNLAQKVGFGAEQVGEFLLPGAAISKTQKLAAAGTRFAESFPRLAKLAPVAEYGSRGALEAVPAMAIAKAQGQENTGGLGVMAAVSPTFGKLLNKTGASRVVTEAGKGIVGKVSKTLSEKIPEVMQSPRQMMWRALKPGVRNREFDKSLNSAMPELYTQAKIAGKKSIENIDDFIELTKATKKRIWEPYQKFLDTAKPVKSPAAGYFSESTAGIAATAKTAASNVMLDGSKIADAIESGIATRQTAKNPAAVETLKEWAATYRAKGQINIADAEDFLQNANAELQSFYAKYPAARHAATEADVALSGTVKEAEALRAGINKIIAQAHPKVKEVYGALSNLEQEAYKRVNVSKRLAPESLTEQMSKVHAAGKFALGVATGHPLQAAGALAEGIAYREAGKMIAKRNTSDYLIKQAFKDFGEYVEKAKMAHRVPTALTGAAQKSGTTP